MTTPSSIKTSVVFRGGSAGIFVRKLLENIFLDNLSINIEYTANGSAHVNKLLIPFKFAGSTHDFSTIPELLNKGQTVIVITQTTTREFFARSLHQVIKWGLEQQYRDNLREFDFIYDGINSYLGSGYSSIARLITDNRFDTKYLNICAFFGAIHLCNPSSNFLLSHEEKISLPLDHLHLLESCISMPYQCILDHDTDTLLSTIAKAINQPLTDAQVEFVVRNFNNYISIQNTLLLKDPEEYFKQLQIKAFAQLDEMKREYDLNACNNDQSMLYCVDDQTAIPST